MPDNWSGTWPVGGPGIPEIVTTYSPPYGTFDKLQGTVNHIVPADYHIAIYIFVVGSYWQKPVWGGSTSILPNGTWQANFVSAGSDRFATKIEAYVVPKTYSPPRAGDVTALPSGHPNWSTLPQELFDQAVASFVIERSAP